MVAHFDPAAVVAWARENDPSRLLDTNSGGPANALGVGDVNDTHDYPWPLGPSAKRPGPLPSSTQYAMLGEMGGMGSFTPGHVWAPATSLSNKGCFSCECRPCPASNRADIYRRGSEKPCLLPCGVLASLLTLR